MANTRLLIVGAGPTGLTAAVEFARNGTIPRVVDRKQKLLPLSRAVGINPRSLTLLEPSGVSERLLAEGVRLRRARFHDGARTIAEVGFTDLNHKYGFLLALPQDRTEAILTERFAEYGGTVEFGVALESAAQSGGHVKAVLGHGDSGRLEEAEFEMLLGADGVHSTVRQATGLPFDGFDLTDRWGVADVDAPDWPFPETFCGFILRDGAIVVVVPIAAGRYRIVANREYPLDLVPGGIPVETVRRKAAFEIAVRQVREYRERAIFLAGDAAHCHSPVGGRGMNLGMADAASLARRFADGTLDGYSGERHRDGRKTIGDSEFGRRALTSKNPLVRLAVRGALSAVGRSGFLRRRAVRNALDI